MDREIHPLLATGCHHNPSIRVGADPIFSEQFVAYRLSEFRQPSGVGDGVHPPIDRGFGGLYDMFGSWKIGVTASPRAIRSGMPWASSMS